MERKGGNKEKKKTNQKHFQMAPLGANVVEVPLVHVYKQHTDEAFRVITASTPVPVYQYDSFA